jgi:hypothetical protein
MVQGWANRGAGFISLRYALMRGTREEWLPQVLYWVATITFLRTEIGRM